MGGLHSKVMKIADPLGVQRKLMSKVSGELGVDDGGHGDPFLMSNEAKDYNSAKTKDATTGLANVWTGVASKKTNLASRRRNNSFLKIGK